MKLKTAARLILLAIGLMLSLPFLKAQDSIFLNGTNKVSFKLKNQVSFYFVNCVQRSASANTTTTVTSISGVGKILLKKDGTGTFQPTSATYTAVWKYSLQNCGYDNYSIWVGTKLVTPPVINPLPPTTGAPSYQWFGHIGNTSKLDYGPTKFKGLRSPTAVAECNGYLYFTKGFVEGNSPIAKTLINDPTEQIEVDKPRNNDFVFEGVSVASDGKRVYLLGFDPHGYDTDGDGPSKIDCGVVVYENDIEVTFQYGKQAKCTKQANPYKSVIGLVQNNFSARPKSIEVDDKYIYIYTSTQKKTFDKFTGASISVVNNSLTSHISSFTRNGNTIIMTDQSVTYNGKVIATAQTSPKVDFYTYTPKDFNTYERKGFVYISSDGTLWIVDAGNSRILHYTAEGVFINHIAYVPMNYNSVIDKNDPTRVFACGIEYKITYPSLKWEQVANWTYGLKTNYLVKENTLNFLRSLHTVNGKTFALVDSCYKDGDQTVRVPCKVYLSPTGPKVVKKYEMFASVSFDYMGNEYVWECSRKAGETAVLYKNSNMLQSVTISQQSALNIDNAFINVTDDGYLIVFNTHKDHTGYHLSWVKDGKIVYNAMPSVTGSNKVYPSGDAFEIGQGVEYAGGHEVYVVGNKVFVKYIGEFFGGSGGQTNLFFVYENGKLLTRGGVTAWQVTGETPKELAGNAYSGGVIFQNGSYYYFYNCEWSGSLQCFKISGI